MITKDSLNAKAGLYLRANGVLKNSQVKIPYKKNGELKPVSEVASGFTPITDIHTYFKYLDILAAYEQAQISAMSSGGTVEEISFDNEIRKVADDGTVTSEVFADKEPFQPIFTMLPFDEPRFKVNLNTRRIEVPTGFIGQQVQDDTYAETIWFEVDRYFDAKDLHNTDISIQWENGKDKGITDAFNVTANLYVADTFGKVIFGWPLTSEVTKNSGNVRFSIRFYQEDEKGEVVYNLTTLPMNLKINDGLILNKNDSEITKVQVHKNFYNNLKEKSFYTIIPAAIPELDELYAVGENTKIVDLSNDGIKILRAKGKVDDSLEGRAGTLNYEWIRYVETEDGKILKDNEYNASSKIINENDKDYSQVEVNEAGAYGVIISNYYGGDTKHYIPSYYKTNDDGEVTGVNADELIQIPYAKMPKFKNKTEQDLKVIVKRGESDKNISFTLEENDKNTPSYQWKYSPAENGQYNDVAKANKEILTFKSDATLTEGWYKVQVTNSRNNSQKSALSDQAFIVTLPAKSRSLEKFTISTNNGGSSTNKTIVEKEITLIEAAGKTVIKPVLKSSNPNTIDSLTSYTVEWYKNISSGEKASNANAKGELVINNDAEDGQYVCRVTTIYNGDSAISDYTVMVFY